MVTSEIFCVSGKQNPVFNVSRCEYQGVREFQSADTPNQDCLRGNLIRDWYCCKSLKEIVCLVCVFQSGTRENFDPGDDAYCAVRMDVDLMLRLRNPVQEIDQDIRVEEYRLDHHSLRRRFW